MLSREDNELMCRVGPLTAMGKVWRRYWVPILQSSDLPEPEGDPRHVELFGENLVAFRAADGTVGLLDEHCCHRGASLTLGRVEGCGIRCIYHGWKFAPDGEVLDTPNVPDQKFKSRIRARAYPTREAGGFVWAYLGATESQPPFPSWSWFDVPPTHRVTAMHVVECNFVQVLEGLLDSSHLNILHSDGMRRTGESALGYAGKLNAMQYDAAPWLEAQDTPFGFRYAAIREAHAGQDGAHARITHFVAPGTVLNANGDVVTIVVPAADQRSIFFHLFWDKERPLGTEPYRTEQLRFVGLDAAALETYGIGARSGHDRRPSHANRFHQDRDAMRNGSFSGIGGLIEEDVAVSASAGAIRNRDAEVLTRADFAVHRLYTTLLNCARRVDSGQEPVGVGADVSGVRGVSGLLRKDEPWQAHFPL